MKNSLLKTVALLVLAPVLTAGLSSCAGNEAKHAEDSSGELVPASSETVPDTSSDETSAVVSSGLKAGSKILFAGDSITDGGRTDYAKKTDLATGYPSKFQKYMKRHFSKEKHTYYNTGVSGDTTLDLYFRIQEDVFDLQPDYLFLFIGVNDSWMGLEQKTFEQRYRLLIKTITEGTNAKIILFEPFLLEPDQSMTATFDMATIKKWIPYIKDEQTIIRKISEEYNLPLICLGEAMEQLHTQYGKDYNEIASDAIHPSDMGQQVMVDQLMLKLGITGYTPQYPDIDLSGVTPKIKEPAVSDAASKSGQMPKAQGVTYCAVGKVDAAAKTAKILLSGGEIVTAKYKGAAPKSGQVSQYKQTGGECEFQQPAGERTEPKYGTSALIAPYARNMFFQTGTGRKYFDEESVVFVRYSATSWRVFKGRSLARQVGAVAQEGKPVKAYVHSVSKLDGLADVVGYVMVTGTFGKEDEWKPADQKSTKFLDPLDKGWAEGDKDLS